jgi:long-chain acyl-CoA synthetase
MAVFPDYAIPAATARSLDGLFRERLKRSPDKVAYTQFEEAENRWIDRSWSETAERVRRWQAGLSGEDLKPGDRVAIMAPNCWDWMACEQAALGLGLVVVPLFCRDRPDNSAYVIRHSGAKFLLIGDGDLWRGIASDKDGVENLTRAVSLQPAHDDTPSRRLRTIEEWLPPPAAELKAYDGDAGALATIVYTSGTTGRPKGVMLSHTNILTNTEGGIKACQVRPTDLFLSFLPLSHMFERTVGYYVPMMAGAVVAYARSVRDLGEDMKTQKPTILISVPLVFERIYSQFREKVEDKGPVMRWLVDLLVDAGWAEFEHAQGRRGWSPLQILAPLGRDKIGKALLHELGGRLRIAVSGGAALPAQISKVFLGLGIVILQGFGLTETSPVISVNRRETNVPASVGTLFEGVEARIVNAGADASGGDLEVRGPNVMLGYWQNPEATTGTMTPDGWFKTGDKARLEEGRLYIVGRTKEVIVLSNGEKVPPDDMQKAISLDPLFQQVLVIGDNRPYLAAVVSVDPAGWKKFAASHGLESDPDKADKDEKVQKALIQRIDGALRGFPGYAKIRGVVATGEAWTVENGFLTPTLKKRREVILKNYADRINQLYK